MIILLILTALSILSMVILVMLVGSLDKVDKFEIPVEDGIAENKQIDDNSGRSSKKF